MDLEDTKKRLEEDGVEYVVTELEPVKDRYLRDDQPAHVVQYFTPTGDDAVVLCIGSQCKVVNLAGFFNHPVPVPDAFV